MAANVKGLFPSVSTQRGGITYPRSDVTWTNAGPGIVSNTHAISWDDFLISQGVDPDFDPWGTQEET